MRTLIFILTEGIPFPNSKDYDIVDQMLSYFDRDGNSLKSIRLSLLNTLIVYKTRVTHTISAVEYEALLEELQLNLGKDVVFDLLEGNCEILGIISSTGGYIGAADDFKEIITYLTGKGANSKVFVYDKAASAAFILAGCFREKYCLTKTEFMFHFGSMNEELTFDNSTDESEDENGDYDMSQHDYDKVAEYLDGMFNGCDNGVRKECENLKLLCLDNAQSDVFYAGHLLERLGIVDQCSATPQELTTNLVNALNFPVTAGGKFARLLTDLENRGQNIIVDGVFSVAREYHIEPHPEKGNSE